MKKFITSLILIASITPSTVLAYDINTQLSGVPMMESVTAEMNTADYWISKAEKPAEVLMTPEEIEAFNQKNNVYISRLNNFPDTMTADEIKNYIAEAPDFSEANYYIDGKKLDKSFSDNINKNIALDNISTSNKLKFGIITNRTSIRTYPVSDVVTDASGNLFYDEFQGCEAYYNEPVAILWTSADKNWYFAVAKYHYGWIPTKDIALCRTRSDFETAQAYGDFLVVTGDSISLDENPYDTVTSSMTFSMGTKLPLASKDEYGPVVDNRYVTNNFVLKLPVRNDFGYLEYNYALLPVSRDVSRGYLPYTTENVLKQSFKMLGNIYGWGGMYNSQDCSGYIKYVYACFGFDFSRNSASIASMDLKTTDISQMTTEEKEAFLDTLTPGSLLYFPGHITIYLGKDNGKYFTIGSVGSLVPEDSTQLAAVETVTVMINSLDVKRLNGKTWLDNFTIAAEILN